MRKFNCVSTVSRGISCALPWWATEFTKLAAEFVKFWRGKLWALDIMFQPGYKAILFRPTNHYPRPKHMEVAVVVDWTSWPKARQTARKTDSLPSREWRENRMTVEMNLLFSMMDTIVSVLVVNRKPSPWICANRIHCLGRNPRAASLREMRAATAPHPLGYGSWMCTRGHWCGRGFGNRVSVAAYLQKKRTKHQQMIR